MSQGFGVEFYVDCVIFHIVDAVQFYDLVQDLMFAVNVQCEKKVSKLLNLLFVFFYKTIR